MAGGRMKAGTLDPTAPSVVRKHNLLRVLKDWDPRIKLNSVESRSQ